MSFSGKPSTRSLASELSLVGGVRSSSSNSSELVITNIKGAYCTLSFETNLPFPSHCFDFAFSPSSNSRTQHSMPKDEGPNPDQPVHQGKWTPEEEAYVEALVEEFKLGLLPLAEGTSLRTFLSKMLNCQPMRISKKFVGSNYNGKQVYVRRKNSLSNEEVRSRRAKLQELERKFLAKASPMSAMASSENNNNIPGGGGDAVPPPAAAGMMPEAAGLMGSTSAGLLSAATGGAAGLPGGLDAAALFGGRSNSKAAAAGRALLLGGSGGGGLKAPPAATGGLMASASGENLGGFSTAQLAAELEKRAQSELQSRTSVENFLGSAAELQARASAETLLQNPFGGTNSQSGSRSNIFGAGSRNNLLNAAGSRSNLLNAARNSFHRGGGTSASNLLNAALQKNSTSNLLNAARNSFHKNSTSNLLSSAFGRGGASASNLLQNASFAKKMSTSNLLNAMASSGGLAGLRAKNSTSNLLNAARAAGRSGGGGSSSAAAAGLRSLLASRASAGDAAEGLKSGSSLADLLKRHGSGVDLMSGASAGGNWTRTGSGIGLAGAAGGSRSNLSSLRLREMLKNGGDPGAAASTSSVFSNASFGGAKSSSSRLELAALLQKKGLSSAAALAAVAGDEEASAKKAAAAALLDKEALVAELAEKEAMIQQLRRTGSASGFDNAAGNSAIEEYLLKQKLAGGSGAADGAAASVSAAETPDQAEFRHMLELKRKFLSQDAVADAERAAKRRRDPDGI
ncbi:expressed unknown protein [Seminavis robusta]|uniref:Uncharacterized protein n=1 Tax=Seminavis robusta TaxID=568900 RepID=A0A9N8HFG4_9STRA|nr:expressed unknown protein [Seminavis robusta]|eukprot:Sro454_g146350.2  (741) ;mRNA; r:32949-35171